jgi:dCMP deaminase
MYLPWFPCIDCARAIVQAGIVELVAMEPDLTNPQWGEQFVVSRALLIESAVGLRWYSTSGTG